MTSSVNPFGRSGGGIRGEAVRSRAGCGLADDALGLSRVDVALFEESVEFSVKLGQAEGAFLGSAFEQRKFAFEVAGAGVAQGPQGRLEHGEADRVVVRGKSGATQQGRQAQLHAPMVDAVVVLEPVQDFADPDFEFEVVRTDQRDARRGEPGGFAEAVLDASGGQCVVSLASGTGEGGGGFAAEAGEAGNFLKAEQKTVAQVAQDEEVVVGGGVSLYLLLLLLFMGY